MAHVVKRRGERLYPPRSSRIYWHLTRLRQEIEAIGAGYLAGPGGPPARLVDFGCGDAPYRPILGRYVGEYVGCDLAGNAAADCLLDRPDTLPFADGSVDVVLSSQVLEHTLDPALYLAESHRVLRAGGLLILSTHGVWQYHPDPVDLWRWTSAGLRCIVERGGFVIERFRGIQGPGATGLQIWQDAALSRIPRASAAPFTWVVQRLMQVADALCPPAARDADASAYVLVARKAPGRGVSPAGDAPGGGLPGAVGCGP
jgi:SAM-dependent methyltransferase